MKIDMDQPLLDLEDKPSFGEGITLGKACFQACWHPVQGDDNNNLKSKTDAAVLALKVNEGGVIDLSVEEIAMLKDRTNRGYAHPGLVWRIHSLLDPKAPTAVAEPIRPRKTKDSAA